MWNAERFIVIGPELTSQGMLSQRTGVSVCEEPPDTSEDERSLTIQATLPRPTGDGKMRPLAVDPSQAQSSFKVAFHRSRLRPHCFEPGDWDQER